MDEFSIQLNSPLTEEEWDLLEDVDFDHTKEIEFHTKHGKTVKFIKKKTGKWVSADAIFGAIPFCCDQCGEKTTDTVMGKPRWNYCPSCGADMREE